MKYKGIFFALFLLFLASGVNAITPEFQTIAYDVNLLSESLSYYTGVYEDYYYILYKDDGNLMIAISSDSGENWGYQTIVEHYANNINRWELIVDDSGNLHVAFHTNTPTAEHRYMYSIDNGLTWTAHSLITTYNGTYGIMSLDVNNFESDITKMARFTAESKYYSKASGSWVEKASSTGKGRIFVHSDKNVYWWINTGTYWSFFDSNNDGASWGTRANLYTIDSHDQTFYMRDTNIIGAITRGTTQAFDVFQADKNNFLGIKTIVDNSDRRIHALYDDTVGKKYYAVGTSIASADANKIYLYSASYGGNDWALLETYDFNNQTLDRTKFMYDFNKLGIIATMDIGGNGTYELIYFPLAPTLSNLDYYPKPAHNSRQLKLSGDSTVEGFLECGLSVNDTNSLCVGTNYSTSPSCSFFNFFWINTFNKVYCRVCIDADKNTCSDSENVNVFTVSPPPDSTPEGDSSLVKIYVVGSGETTFRGLDANSFFYNGLKGYVGLDNNAVNTCNLTAPCDINATIGSHTITVYDSWNRYYTKQIDIYPESKWVFVYLPSYYIIYSLFENDSFEDLINCNSFDSTSVGEVSCGSREIKLVYEDDENIFGSFIGNVKCIKPFNCYSYYSLNPKYAYYVPSALIFTPEVYVYETIDDTLYSEVIPTDFQYGSIKLGKTNWVNSFTISGVKEISPRPDPDIIYWKTFSPITKINTYIGGEDSNDLLDFELFHSFSNGDTVKCGIQINSYNYIIYDLNLMLIRDDYNVVASTSIPVNKNCYNITPDLSTNPCYLITYDFGAVNVGADSNLTCVASARNEIGFNSVFAYSTEKTMYLSDNVDYNLYVRNYDGTTAPIDQYSFNGNDSNYALANYKYGIVDEVHDVSQNPVSTKEDWLIIRLDDLNSGRILQKHVYIPRGQHLDFNMFLPKMPSNNAPVIERIELTDNGFLGIKAKAYVYDNDLDLYTVDFNFFLEGGSADNPCDYLTGEGAFKTNNGNDYITSKFAIEECAVGNECWIEATRDKTNCIGSTVKGNTVIYLTLKICDTNNNCDTETTYASIENPKVYYFTQCEPYVILGGEKLTGEGFFPYDETIYTECYLTILGLDTFTNDFELTFRDTDLSFDRNHYDSFNTLYYVFLGDITEEAREIHDTFLSDPVSCYEDDYIVEIDSAKYGSGESNLHLTVCYGDRDDFEGDTEYGSENARRFTNFIKGIVFGIFTDPIEWVQNNFFIFIVLIFVLVIAMPFLIGRKKKER